MSRTFFALYLRQLEKFGIRVDGVTPMVQKKRLLEIRKYLEEHNDVEQFLIIDDEIFGYDFMDHLVYVDLYKGLQPEHIKPSLDILNGKLGFYPLNYDVTETSHQRLVRINKYYKDLGIPPKIVD